VLKLALMKFGVGQWKEIVESGCLPGKLIQQLNGQTQRLLGQQSLATFTRLRIDVDKVRADNLLKTDVKRKNGLIINEGGVLKPEERERQRKENLEKYGVDQATSDAIELEVAGSRETATALGACPTRPASMRTKPRALHLDSNTREEQTDKVVAALTGADVMKVDITTLSWQAKVALLLHLRRELVRLSPSAAAAGPATTASDENLPPAANKQPQKKSLSKKRASTSRDAGLPARKEAARGSTKGRKAAKVSDDEEEEGNSSQLAQLMAMGFSKRKAQDALIENHGNLEMVVEYLFG